MVLSIAGAFRLTLKGINMSAPLDRLKHHVTGAIERGEAVAVTAVDSPGGYNFDVQLHEGKFEVKVDTAAAYGHFEHDELGDERGGGLWFIRPKVGPLELADYDGVPVLPKSVAKALRGAGFEVDADFD